MEEEGSSETLLNVSQTTRHHLPEDCNRDTTVWTANLMSFSFFS